MGRTSPACFRPLCCRGRRVKSASTIDFYPGSMIWEPSDGRNGSPRPRVPPRVKKSLIDGVVEGTTRQTRPTRILFQSTGVRATRVTPPPPLLRPSLLTNATLDIDYSASPLLNSASSSSTSARSREGEPRNDTSPRHLGTPSLLLHRRCR